MKGTNVGGSLTVITHLPLPGPPAVRVEVHLVFGHERDPFAAQPLRHYTGRFEVAPARQHPVAVHHAVAGQVAPHRVLQRPAHDPGRPPPPQVRGDVAVGGDAAHRDLRDDTPDGIIERRRRVDIPHRYLGQISPDLRL